MKYVYVETIVDSNTVEGDYPEIAVFASKGMAEFDARQRAKELENEGYKELFSEDRDDWWCMDYDGSTIQIFIDKKEVNVYEG